MRYKKLYFRAGFRAWRVLRNKCIALLKRSLIQKDIMIFHVDTTNSKTPRYMRYKLKGVKMNTFL